MVEEVDDGVGLFVCHGGVAGEAELLGVNALSNRERQVVPFTVAQLLVGWDGVVDLGLYIVVGKILAERITVGTKDGEDVVDAVAIAMRNDDCAVFHLINIYMRNLFPTAVHRV